MSRPSDEDTRQMASESTPLLGENRGNESYGAGAQPTEEGRPLSVREIESSTAIKSRRRWWSALALFLLSVFMVLIMLLGFFVPETMKAYALEATTVDIKGVVPEFTGSGVKVRVLAEFSLQSSKVQNAHVRNLGVLGTWIARQVETSESQLQVTLPEYGDVVVGTAIIPPLKVSIVDGQVTSLNFASDLIPPKGIEGLKAPLDNWITGSLDHLQLAGSAEVALRSGIIKIPSTTISQIISLTKSNIPAMPQFNITKLNFHDNNSTDGPDGMMVDASIQIQNDFPIDLSIPSLGFTLMVNNCLPSEPKILLADAIVEHSIIRSREDVTVSAVGFVRKPSDSLIEICPKSGKSPLDTLLGGYIRGHTITVYVRGSDYQPEGTPAWLSNALSDLVIPFPFTGHSFGNVIKNFTFSDVSFGLPDSDSDSNSPQVSATIKAFITLPQEMNFAVDVQHVRATADVFHKGKKIGVINLKKWQNATSTPLQEDGEQPMLLVESDIDKAPLDITDEDAFTEVFSQLIFGKTVILLVKALVDVEINTALGVLTVQEIPAGGSFPVKPVLGKGITEELKPVINDIIITSTTPTSINLKANVDVNNPTKYSATIPYVDVHILVNDTILGHTTIRNLAVVPGLNKNLTAEAEWSPVGDSGLAVGRELISQYISGWNVSFTIQTHRDTIPSLPLLGEALSRIQITLPIPHLGGSPNNPDDPDDPDDEDSAPRFIKGATLHLLSSTATFILSSPLNHTSLFITYLNATAFYKDDEVGNIFLPELPPDDPYFYELEVPPGVSMTDKLPVSWDLGSVGYEAVRKALGGTLKLSAKAEAGVRLGEWREKVWISGSGIGAGVRL